MSATTYIAMRVILPLVCTSNRDLKFVLFLGLQSLLGLRIGPYNGPMPGSMLFLPRFPPRLILLALLTAANSSEEYGVATSVHYDDAVDPGLGRSFDAVRSDAHSIFRFLESTTVVSVGPDALVAIKRGMLSRLPLGETIRSEVKSMTSKTREAGMGKGCHCETWSTPSALG